MARRAWVDARRRISVSECVEEVTPEEMKHRIASLYDEHPGWSIAAINPDADPRARVPGA